jgi:hypothetical protein
MIFEKKKSLIEKLPYWANVVGILNTFLEIKIRLTYKALSNKMVKS